MDRSERYVKNEALFRALNNEASAVGVKLATADPDDVAPYLCECVDAECLERITLTYAEYARLRANPLWFAVVPGHVQADVEVVIEQTDRYAVVEKTQGKDVAVSTA